MCFIYILIHILFQSIVWTCFPDPFIQHRQVLIESEFFPGHEATCLQLSWALGDCSTMKCFEILFHAARRSWEVSPCSRTWTMKAPICSWRKTSWSSWKRNTAAEWRWGLWVFGCFSSIAELLKTLQIFTPPFCFSAGGHEIFTQQNHWTWKWRVLEGQKDARERRRIPQLWVSYGHLDGTTLLCG